MNPTPENPAASAATQNSVNPALVRSSGLYGCEIKGYVTQKFMATDLNVRRISSP